MMVAHPTPPLFSLEEYLELEENSTVKHEYIDGHVYAMASGTINHGLIAVNAVAALRSHLRGGPCRVYNSDVGVQLAARRIVYPDVSVSCDPRDHADGGARFISHPLLLVEVLSPATAAYDRGDEFAMYQALDSVREYLLLDAERRAGELWTRRADGSWRPRAFGPGEDLYLATIDLRITAAVFYEDVVV